MKLVCKELAKHKFAIAKDESIQADEKGMIEISDNKLAEIFKQMGFKPVGKASAQEPQDAHDDAQDDEPKEEPKENKNNRFSRNK